MELYLKGRKMQKSISAIITLAFLGWFLIFFMPSCEESLSELTSDPTESVALEKAKGQLQIQWGWTWVKERNYSYIRGRVKNIGNTTICYFEVVALYRDANEEVLDTDFTNSGEDLRPGWSKEFEIMHTNKTEYKHVSIHVQGIRTY